MKGLRRLLGSSLAPLLLIWMGLGMYNWPMLSLSDPGHGNNLILYMFLVWGALTVLSLAMSLAGSHKQAESKDEDDRGESS
ncbi:hypothetical protein [Salidesulfovibrio onnuriiensis]|uniref:hypothetical protein n=1 Tax=Salidesulfovibrio onnuriiensis TaxID=2583823 RepID=UPI0011CC1C76|nr:hypothetical protein [Salidesulfovibrio onnuriiensis]